jgi:hypothetical protein
MVVREVIMRRVLLAAAICGCHASGVTQTDPVPSALALPQASVADVGVPPPDASLPDTAPSATAMKASCETLFAPPPNADPLCDEHVIATVGEIHWRSYGVTDARANVNRQYQAMISSCTGASLTSKPPAFEIEQGEKRLETFESTNTTFPACSQHPRPAHQTVVIISEMIRRK